MTVIRDINDIDTFVPTVEQAKVALSQFVNRTYSLHVPPEFEDADIVISCVIDQWQKLQAQVATLTEALDTLDRYVDFSTSFDNGVCDKCGNGYVDANGINIAMDKARQALENTDTSRYKAMQAVVEAVKVWNGEFSNGTDMGMAVLRLSQSVDALEALDSTKGDEHEP